MNKLSPINILVAAALLAIAAESAWAEEATPGSTATPAAQTAAPGTGHVPGMYPPRPDRGGYAQPRQQPSQWPAPPPGHNQTPPYYPPYGQYQAVPAAPAVNPLSTTLKATQEQLTAKTTELDTTKGQMARLQAELEAAMAALQKAHSDTINAGQQVDATRAQVDTLKHILCELAARIEARKTALQNALQTTAAASDDPDSAAAGEVDLEIAEQAKPQTAPKCSQLTQYPAITSGQRAKTIIKQQAR